MIYKSFSNIKCELREQSIYKKNKKNPSKNQFFEPYFE